jgi:cell division protein FtsZ
MILPGLISLDRRRPRRHVRNGQGDDGRNEATGDDATAGRSNAIANLDETSLKGARPFWSTSPAIWTLTLLLESAKRRRSAEVDGDANIIFGAAFDPALDSEARSASLGRGHRHGRGCRFRRIGPLRSTFNTRRPAAPMPTRPEPVRHEPFARTGRGKAAIWNAPEPAPVVAFPVHG